ncbi:MAG TPA: ATP-binding protein [Bacteroidota bacterium]|nr:ATP-binding protein [Bacteroidota bacterium]
MAWYTRLVPDRLRRKLSEYRFEIRHVIVLFAVLIAFQIILALLQKSLLGGFLQGTQNWFQKYYAERIAIVTSASLELLFQNQSPPAAASDSADNMMVYSLNVFFKQQLIQRSIEDIRLILLKDGKTYVVANGQALYAYFRGTLAPWAPDSARGASQGMAYYLSVQNDLHEHERIISRLSNGKTFDVVVPFVPQGEYIGALYMRITPDFSFLTNEVRANADELSVVFSALIVVGLIAIFVVSSRAVRERDDMQRKLFAEHQEYLENRIRLEKESLFTRRIYHTHHKAEKIIGFIKEDARRMNGQNLDELKARVLTYANFISRIIYDMKWYDQDINTIVNPIFSTDINAVITFIVRHVFLRITSKNEMFEIHPDLEPSLPLVHVNEFIVWEILEPLIQNSIDHGGKPSLTITVRTRHVPGDGRTVITIEDDGVGIREEFLTPGPRGVQRLFLEHETTKGEPGVHSGYGCYIAYQLAVGKCGWQLEAANLPAGGCRFTITVRND